jgi:hypothetical protein
VLEIAGHQVIRTCGMRAFFVLGINTSAYTQLNRAARHKQKYRCGRAEGLQQR